MNDLTGLTHSFQGWRAVLDFLANLKSAESIKRIDISKQNERAWKMHISKTDTMPKPRARGAALYDLYW